MAAPLEGVTVGLSGSEPMTKKLSAALEPLGARTFIAQQSVIQELPLPIKLDSLCDGAPRWLVFTSANGVKEFFRRLKSERVDLRRLHSCRFAVIGAATGRALSAQGFQADLCPKTYTTAALAQALLDTVPPQGEIVLLRSRLGSDELFQTLSASRTVRDLHLYDAVPAPLTEDAAEWLERADYLVFTSAGGVKMFLEQQGGIPPRAQCVCIGEVTAAALARSWGGTPIVAQDTSVEGIAAAILSHHTA
ncbi:MAG: uroporphyrinogen-III synthase [Clostridiales bacterium]|nr:uroporphyrinogen-III synthase [Clostridiales bacterium]